jgi:hypothetical protein
MRLTSFSPAFGTGTLSFWLSLAFLTSFGFVDLLAKSIEKKGMKDFKT